MINKSVDFFENYASDLGLSIKIPRPGKAVRKVSAVTNGIVGVGLITSGVIISSKALISLGVLGLVGSAVLAIDKEKE